MAWADQAPGVGAEQTELFRSDSEGSGGSGGVKDGSHLRSGIESKVNGKGSEDRSVRFKTRRGRRDTAKHRTHHFQALHAHILPHHGDHLGI